ncbi:MAG TPA: aminopeptidase P N-terminal domain-containing protein [Vicinamibacterales bacterium]|jgi:Xaa-Pro aminopeptidase|nr:aminopeptidase P N-terminal domain-containing protein [Vicinamibacterales bacterium]
MRHLRTIALLGLVWTLVPPAVNAGPLQEDLKARRSRAMERLGPDTMAIFWSAPTRRYSLDVDYEYRQDSNLLYLTGIDQEETILVLMPGNETRREILFIRDADPRREHWNGHSLTAGEATAQSGIATVMSTTLFEPFIAAMLSSRPMGAAPTEYAKFFDAIAAARAKVAVPLEPQVDLSTPPGAANQFAAKLRERFFGFSLLDATPVVTDLRQIKTAYEQDVMRKSLLISSEAHRAGMKAAAPGKYEYEVEAAIENVYLRSGAMSWGYPSIVGSGPNATILHYEKSSRRMEPGDLLLVDAAANYHGYTGDITRTYPIDGTFTRTQRDIYEIVLAAQDAGMAAAKTGNNVSAIQAACDDVLRAGLVRLGLVTDPKGQQFKIWSTHGVSHWLGMDVHDVGRQRQLAPGMAFVIEPGIYIREAALENLPRTPENTAFIDKVRPMVEKYKNIGVRIEDSFLLTETGLERLSSTVPRTIEEIEGFLKPGTSTARK